MRTQNDSRSMPLVLAGTATGFALAASGLILGSPESTERGLWLVALVAPLALGYLHFTVLVDAPWLLTWSGLLLGGVGSVLLALSGVSPGALAVAGIGYALIGLGFILSPTKPTPPGIFFIAGGIGLIAKTMMTAVWLDVTALVALTFTFAFGAVASAMHAIAGRQQQA